MRRGTSTEDRYGASGIALYSRNLPDIVTRPAAILAAYARVRLNGSVRSARRVYIPKPDRKQRPLVS